MILYRGTTEAIIREHRHFYLSVTPIRNVAVGYAWRTWLMWSAMDRKRNPDFTSQFYPLPAGLPILETYESDKAVPDGTGLPNLLRLPSNSLEYTLLSAEALQPPGWPQQIIGNRLLVRSLCPEVWGEECQPAFDETNIAVEGETLVDVTYCHCTCLKAPWPTVHVLAQTSWASSTIEDLMADIRHGGQ